MALLFFIDICVCAMWRTVFIRELHGFSLNLTQITQNSQGDQPELNNDDDDRMLTRWTLIPFFPPTSRNGSECRCEKWSAVRKRAGRGTASGLTSQHTQPGGGRDLPCRVGGVTFVNGFVSGGPQRLDPQDWARAVIKLYYLQKKRGRKLWGFFCLTATISPRFYFMAWLVAANSDSSFFFYCRKNDCWDVALSNVLSGRRHPEEVHKALWGSHATKLPCKILMPSVIPPEVCDLQLPGRVCNGVCTAALGAPWECWRW